MDSPKFVEIEMLAERMRENAEAQREKARGLCVTGAETFRSPAFSDHPEDYCSRVERLAGDAARAFTLGNEYAVASKVLREIGQRVADGTDVARAIKEAEASANVVPEPAFVYDGTTHATRLLKQILGLEET